MVIAVALACVLAVQADAPPELHLMCSGSGRQGVDRNVTAYSHDNYGNTATTTATESRTVGFDDEVRVDITGETGRVRIPQTMLPPLRGGDEGWFNLRKIEATAEEITAVATINLINKIKLRLDRVTGRLSFTTLRGSFAGRCQRIDPAAGRAF